MLSATYLLGHVIRSIDEDNAHFEYWTNDGEYVPDDHFRAAAELLNPSGNVAADGEHLSDAEYVAAKGLRCPVCGCEQIEGDSTDMGGGSATQEMSCTDCGASWTDHYRLTGYGDLEVEDDNEEDEA